ncbi:MAG TPA: FAD-dependent oxidoreductase [Xanthomonadaceae bacterium]|jgi:D-amino-acid dehydrogenase|nr:FAD-dependent oxidoreductase [Xanthomonadaceae bacterium]
MQSTSTEDRKARAPGPSADVLIVGGGVIGLACAYELQQAGRQVRVIEQRRIGSGSSHGNCGTLTPSHAEPLAAPGVIAKALRWMFKPDAPFYVAPRFDPSLWRWLWRFARRCNARDHRATTRAKGALLQASRGLIEQLVREHALDCEFAADGLLYAFIDPRERDAMLAELPLLHDIGIAAETWDAARLAADEPSLRDGLAGGLFFPGDASLRPDRYVDELARLAREAGCELIEDCEVHGFRRERGRIVGIDTGRGPQRGRDVLIATGAWSPALVRQLGFALPIQPGKGYSITWDAQRTPPRRPLVLKERSVCVTAWGSGFRLGSTMEFSGYDDSLNRTRLDAIERGAAEYLRDAPAGARHEEWFGWRPMTFDDLPILGRAPGSDNLWLATGHGMMGVGMSAATGRLIADLMCGRDPILDPAPYSPSRFR